jgi:hypothetical protein
MRFVVWIWVAALLWRKGEFDLCAKLKREMEMDGGDGGVGDGCVRVGGVRVGYTRMGNVSSEGRNRWVRLRCFLKENVEVMCL